MLAARTEIVRIISLTLDNSDLFTYKYLVIGVAGSKNNDVLFRLI